MSNNQDPAKLIAERVARRLAGDSAARETPASASRNGAALAVEPPRARIIDFVSAAPPPRTTPSIVSQPDAIDIFESRPMAPQVAQSPWLAPFSRSLSESPLQNPKQSANELVTHASQERFGIEEAAISELVEFFENEKMCTVDPSGKPCDHCAMCSSRGF